MPLLQDCSKIKRLSNQPPNNYMIDPKGTGNVDDAVEVVCFNEWTVFLSRKQTAAPEVSQ